MPKLHWTSAVQNDAKCLFIKHGDNEVLNGSDSFDSWLAMCGLAFWLRYNHQVDWSGDVAEVFPEAQIEKASERI